MLTDKASAASFDDYMKCFDLGLQAARNAEA